VPSPTSSWRASAAATGRPRARRPAHGASLAGVPWSLVYQSRSGAPTTPWLEPDINDAIADLAERGVKAVVIAPIGFVSDHLEVMWDLDEEALTTAREAGLHAERVPTPGVHPAFVTGLVDLVQERLAGQTDPVTPRSRPALTALGPWYDVCRPGCCLNPAMRGPAAEDRPAVAGLAP
jgi:protoporphyrin/coproporphyrin ferrochelatase